MKGYKSFWINDEGVYCTGGIGGSPYTEWEFGEIKETEESPVLCETGYHFFHEYNFCFGLNFYVGKTVVVCEVEILGEVVEDTYKCATNKIKLIKDVTEEIMEKVDNDNNSGKYNSGSYNSGKYNSGNRNSGNRNSGDCNSGCCNSGYCNSGYCNSGNYNTGYCNSGNYNTGNCNSGDCNSGSYNSGHRNSGDYNSGDYNSGLFNTNEPNMRMFNKETNMTHTEWKNSDLFVNFELNLFNKTYEEAWIEWWENNKSEDTKNRIKKLPNFDKEIFEQITGIDIDND